MDMEVKGTREAFMALISQHGFGASSGINKGMLSLWRSGKRVPTLDKMEEVLLKSGAAVITEKVWEVK